MKQTIFTLFVTLLLTVGTSSICYSQNADSSADKSEPYVIKTQGLEISIEPKGDPDPTVEEENLASIPTPANLYARFEELEAVLSVGDANDRVRELQASLNRALRGETIELRELVYVSDALGPRSDGSDTASDRQQKIRKVYSKDSQKAFVIRGNWRPLDESGPIGFDQNEDLLRLTTAVKMPDEELGEPIKVDGVYGQHTEAAVALFQWQHRLPVTGRVDVVTLDKLEPMIPTNPLLAVIMNWIDEPGIGAFKVKRTHDDYPYWVKTCTSLIMTLIICLFAGVAYQIARMGANSTRFLTRWLFTPSSSPWFAAMREHKVFLLAAQFAPAILIYFAALAIFPAPDENHDKLPYLNVFQNWRGYLANIGLAYLSLVLMLVSFAIANTFDAVFNPDHETENPIGSIIRAAKRLIAVIGTLMIFASLTGKHPFYIIGGLGAFTAVFMLVFKDHLLGLVASIQIIANRVVKVGDWIVMPKFNADGDVQEISLGLIKVQNFDKTVSTIPTSAVLTESFRNWTGMQESGGRRIKRAILIDMHSIQVCTPVMIQRFEKIELIGDYIAEKKAELAEYNRTHNIEASTVNSRRLTNIGTFRAYLKAYLGAHPGLTSEMTFLVRHLQPTNNGLPIEIYAFTNETNWSTYESVQADIFDHILAILPEFGLQTFQEITDVRTTTPSLFSSPDLQSSLAEVELLIEDENAELSDNPRRKLTTSLRKVQQRIKDLRLGEHVDAEGAGRVITLRQLQLS